MSVNEHQSTQQLITTIEQKDRIFRMASVVFIAMIIMALISFILVQQRTLDVSRQTLQGVQTQLDKQQIVIQAIQTASKENAKGIDTLNRHLDCIVVYFGEPNRAQLTIEDINKCTIAGTNHGTQQFFDNSQPSPQPSVTVNNLQPAMTPIQPAQQPQTTQPVNPTPEPEKPVEPPKDEPKSLVCLPILNLCV